MERFVSTEQERQNLVRFIEAHQLPFVCATKKGSKRSLDQNRLQRLWVNECTAQWDGMTAEEVRGFFKLTLGVPIMRSESEVFRQKYDRILKPLGHEQKIELMMEPLDLPVTRIMTTKQHSVFLDHIQRFASERGWVLTQPDDGLGKHIEKAGAEYAARFPARKKAA